jgi:hypothetical protein
MSKPPREGVKGIPRRLRQRVGVVVLLNISL